MAHAHDSDETKLGRAALLTGGFMVVEALGGWLSGSLALLADAGHMLTDFAALALAWSAMRFARRPADRSWTFGHDRLSVLAAFVNGLALLAIVAWIAWEAVARLREPVEVMGGTMMAVAVLGLVVNMLVFRMLHSGKGNLNVRAAALHVLGDLLGSVGAILAAGVILITGWSVADPAISLVVACLIVTGAIRILRESGRILLEGTPKGLDLGRVAADLRAQPGVASIHHLHAWAITEERRMITLHARLEDGAEMTAVRDRLRERLVSRHGIGHATIEVEPSGAAARDTHEDCDRER